MSKPEEIKGYDEVGNSFDTPMRVQPSGERIVADLPMGYAVVAKEMPVTTAVPVHPSGMMPPGMPQRIPVNQTGLIPYPNEGHWHTELCERACDCGGDCWMAWLCPVFPLAQAQERLKFLGVDKQGYQEVVLGALILCVLDLVISAMTKSESFSLPIFCGLVLCQLRGLVRAVLGIVGSQCDDCLLSFFCTPCTLIQLVGTLWVQPKQVPGCTFDQQAAYVV